MQKAGKLSSIKLNLIDYSLKCIWYLYRLNNLYGISFINHIHMYNMIYRGADIAEKTYAISRFLAEILLANIAEFITFKNCSTYDVISNAYAFFIFWNKNYFSPPIAKSANIADFFLTKNFGDIALTLYNIFTKLLPKRNVSDDVIHINFVHFLNIWLIIFCLLYRIYHKSLL